MPQLQNLVLKDRAATPVDHIFTPRPFGTDGVANVVESSGTPIGDNRISVKSVRTPSGKYKSTIAGVFPVVQTQTINGVSTPVVVRTAYVNLQLTFDATSSLEERNNVVGMVADMLTPGKVLINDTLVKLEGIY